MSASPQGEQFQWGNDIWWHLDWGETRREEIGSEELELMIIDSSFKCFCLFFGGLFWHKGEDL